MMYKVFSLTVLLALTPAVAAEKPNNSDVHLTDGQVRGVVSEDVIAFKGIPFAAPPVGQFRWRAPQPPAKWQGVREASSYAHDCMQLPFPSDAAPLGTPPAEDCLYLNIWKPAAARTKLPILVWIYGGGFVNGGSSPPTYSGATLAKQGIIFVSFNYRLGRFGTFAHPLLSKANADQGRLGNYGTMDQIAALRWVKRNAAAIGGDPHNVTIIGESAGGMSVHQMLTSPLTKGLFNKAVIQSGGNGAGMSNAGMKFAEQAALNFAQSKGIAADDPQALIKLRAMSAEDVTDGLNLTKLGRTGSATNAPPYADGKVSVEVAKAYASGRFQHVPIMIGATSDDIGGKNGIMIKGAHDLAGLIATKGVPAYHYRFSYVAESLRRPSTKGASHASDIPYFFDTQAIKYGEATTVKDRAVGKMISSYLINFVKSGDPNGPGLTPWQRTTQPGDALLDFTAEGGAVLGKDVY